MVSPLRDSEKETLDFFKSVFKELLRTESIPKKQVNAEEHNNLALVTTISTFNC